MPEPLTEQDLIGDGWLPPRARFDTDAPLVSLNGEWAFRGSPSPAAAPDDVADPDLDDRDWSRVPVPSSLPMQGHGLPVYTNTRFPFPVDPPHVPDENPVGDHRLAFEWEADDRAVLRFDGIDAAAEVWLNGVRLGSTAGSRLVHEFDVAGVLRTGSNLLAVRELQWAPTSYLEDQDMWWLPGVFRDVSLQAAPAGGLQDVVVRAGWADGAGVLHVDAETRDGATAVVDVEDDAARPFPAAHLTLAGAEPIGREVHVVVLVRLRDRARLVHLQEVHRDAEMHRRQIGEAVRGGLV